jgi:RNA polymerase sigma-70 factor (ECF subfamily)
LAIGATVGTRSGHWDWPSLRAHSAREARRFLSDPQDAEDVVQEAMTRAWRKRESCRTPAAPLAWVLQITRNEAFRHLQRRRGEAVVALAGCGDEGEPATDFPGERLAVRVDVRRALARLPAQDQVLLQLRYSEDLAQNRIALLLETPEGTIRVRLHRLRKKLRTRLDHGFEDDREPQRSQPGARTRTPAPGTPARDPAGAARKPP